MGFLRGGSIGCKELLGWDGSKDVGFGDEADWDKFRVGSDIL